MVAMRFAPSPLFAPCSNHLRCSDDKLHRPKRSQCPVEMPGTNERSARLGPRIVVLVDIFGAKGLLCMQLRCVGRSTGKRQGAYVYAYESYISTFINKHFISLININTCRYIYQHPINQYQYISTRIDEYQDSTYQYVSPINQCPAIHINSAYPGVCLKIRHPKIRRLIIMVSYEIAILGDPSWDALKCPMFSQDFLGCPIISHIEYPMFTDESHESQEPLVGNIGNIIGYHGLIMG